MALSPKEMEQAMLRNLKEKTGKTLEAWKDILSASGIQNAKEQIAYLKIEFALGHFQANVIAKQMSANEIDIYANEAALIDLQFKNENESLREIYDALVLKLHNLGGDVVAKPCKTYIPFYRKQQFLIVKTQKGRLILGLPIEVGDYIGKTLLPKGLGFPEKIKMAIPLASKHDINEGVIHLILKAYRGH